MAGTLPHAVFVETGLPGGRVTAFAGELPGCAATADSPETAVTALPARVAAFVAWLRAAGESVEEPVGNWYEVERAAVIETGRAVRRASFSLDDLPPTGEELSTWLRWAELAREELAGALDAEPEAAARLRWLAAQDRALTADLAPGRATDRPAGDRPAAEALDELYLARDALLAAIAAVGPGGPGVRRAVRLAIADDLRASEDLAAR
jgi:hypothetical protein